MHRYAGTPDSDTYLDGDFLRLGGSMRLPFGTGGPALIDLGSGDWSGGGHHGTNSWSGRFGDDAVAAEEAEVEAKAE